MTLKRRTRKRVLYVQYTNPAGYPPLQHSSRILAEAGWDVLFIGTGAAGADSLTFPQHPNITVRRTDFCAPGWRQKVHYLKFCLQVLWTALIWRPQWIYASDSLSCPIASVLTFIPGFRVLYHEHDTPAALAGNAFLSLVSRARRMVASRADLCVIPNGARLERFERELSPVRKATCVWNCPGLYELTTAVRHAAESSIWVLYHGTIVPERLPRSVIEALAALPEAVRLRVIGYETAGSTGYVADLQRLAASLGVGHRVEFCKPLSRQSLLAMTLKCDVGLAMIPMTSSDQNFEAMTGASNKVFDYLACGLPVIVSRLPEWEKMFVASGYGLAALPDEAGSIAAAIGCFATQLQRMREMGEAGRQKVFADWNYESLFQPVFDRMEQNT